MVARIVYKMKKGWRTGKQVYFEGEPEKLEAYAKRVARGREFQIQELKPENIPEHYEGHICKL